MGQAPEDSGFEESSLRTGGTQPLQQDESGFSGARAPCPRSQLKQSEQQQQQQQQSQSTARQTADLDPTSPLNRDAAIGKTIDVARMLQEMMQDQAQIKQAVMRLSADQRPSAGRPPPVQPAPALAFAERRPRPLVITHALHSVRCVASLFQAISAVAEHVGLDNLLQPNSNTELRRLLGTQQASAAPLDISLWVHELLLTGSLNDDASELLERVLSVGVADSAFSFHRATSVAEFNKPAEDLNQSREQLGLPQHVLAIQLVRSGAGPSDETFARIDPELDLRGEAYRLCAVIAHGGTPEAGTFVSYVTLADGQSAASAQEAIWFRCDDESIAPICFASFAVDGPFTAEGSGLQEDACMLFYARGQASDRPWESLVAAAELAGDGDDSLFPCRACGAHAGHSLADLFIHCSQHWAPLDPHRAVLNAALDANWLRQKQQKPHAKSNGAEEACLQRGGRKRPRTNTIKTVKCIACGAKVRNQCAKLKEHIGQKKDAVHLRIAEYAGALADNKGDAREAMLALYADVLIAWEWEV